MRSHLEDGSNRRPPRQTVFTADQVDAMAGGGQGAVTRTPHGDVVSASQIHDHVGGSRGVLEGAPQDAQARMYTEAGLPYAARDWRGSATIYTDRELPPNDFVGSGFAGTTQICTAADLDRLDQQHGTGVKTGVPSQPGAYLLRDGNVLLIAANGQKAVITQAQFQELQQRQRAQQPPAGSNLVGRLRAAVKGKTDA